MADLDPALIDRAVQEATTSEANRDYFFDSLKSPVWIEPLVERGLFADPPEQFIDEKGYVRAQRWSPSRYLARVASDSPQVVTNTIASIKTNNERIHEDFVEAALAMPRDFSRIIAHLESEYVGSLKYVYYALPQKLTKLGARMVELGEVDIALELMTALFAPSPETLDDGFGTKRLQSRFSDWQYDNLLGELTQKLVAVVPRAVIRELVLLLGQGLDLLRPDEQDAANLDLITRIWWVRVADDRHRAVRVEGALVSTLRDAAREVHSAALLPDDELVSLLSIRPEEIFRRIAMDALARGPEPDLEAVRRLVADPALIVGDPSVEYRELLTATGHRLPAADIDRLVAAIREGAIAERERIASSREATEDELDRYVAFWKVGRLELLWAALDESGREEYDALRKVVPDAELPVNFETRTFSGPTSPYTIEELGALDDEELLQLLRTWEPEPDPIGPSREGLARALAAFAERDPARVAELARGLRDLRPAFVQWAFEGLSTALNQRDVSFDWDPVIDLAEWVAEQPREIPGGRGDDYSDLDPGWVWTRRQIVSLLERGLDLQDGPVIPLERRPSVWRVIELVADDPDPTPENEEKFGGSNMDPLTLALNTTRPRALFAAFSYGHWLKRALSERSEAAETADGFLSSAAPELAALLEKHLDPTRDPSAAVRAAIGHHFASLFVLDANWARDHASQIFPAEGTALREAAWGAYVIYTQPYDDLFTALGDVYRRSAELAGEPAHGFRWDEAPQAHLGEHLVSFYWRGKLALDDELFTVYWSNAPSDVRRHVLDFVGRSVGDLPELEDEVRERLLGFWAYARAQAVAAGTADELAPLAWWMRSEALPADWRLGRLSDLLDLGVKPDPVYAVIESLPSLVREGPKRSVEVLRRILELERTEWSYDLWDEQTFEVLRVAMASGDLEAYELAVDTTHWLGSLGYRQYRELLK